MSPTPTSRDTLRTMTSAIGHIESGGVRLDESVDWADGQAVLVIPLPVGAPDRPAPPPELLEEDAREFATLPDTIADMPRTHVSVVPGEIYLADIFERSTRPVIVVSREQLNRGGLFLVAPVTSSRVGERRRYANYVFLPVGAGGVRDDSVAVTHLVQPVRSEMLRDKWGQISESLMQQVLVGIAWSIDLVK